MSYLVAKNSGKFIVRLCGYKNSTVNYYNTLVRYCCVRYVYLTSELSNGKWESGAKKRRSAGQTYLGCSTRQDATADGRGHSLIICGLTLTELAVRVGRQLVSRTPSLFHRWPRAGRLLCAADLEVAHSGIADDP